MVTREDECLGIGRGPTASYDEQLAEVFELIGLTSSSKDV